MEAEAGGYAFRAGSGRDTIAGPEVCSTSTLSDRINVDKPDNTGERGIRQIDGFPDTRTEEPVRH